jgi:hypothetical protein
VHQLLLIKTFITVTCIILTYIILMLGTQAGGIAPTALSIIVHINLHRNQGDTGLKTNADGTSDTASAMSFTFTNLWINLCFTTRQDDDSGGHEWLHRRRPMTSTAIGVRWQSGAKGPNGSSNEGSGRGGHMSPPDRSCVK